MTIYIMIKVEKGEINMRLIKGLVTLIILITNTNVFANNNQEDLTNIINKSRPAVVNITSISEVSDTIQKSRSQNGSGVIIDGDHGIIVTNAHVVENASTILIKTINGANHFASLVGKDDSTDLAVLKVKSPLRDTIKIGKSSKLSVGDQVSAIGTLLG